ncbi:hypothetical protein PUN28_013095 [Cardiocondyla obscurior]|uniref:Uncharacterized protein n=1 Tax=Cardiocondyla obscurior TaxID=286306 RepID=A0AAW2F6P5_9HYME
MREMVAYLNKSNMHDCCPLDMHTCAHIPHTRARIPARVQKLTHAHLLQIYTFLRATNGERRTRDRSGISIDRRLALGLACPPRAPSKWKPLLSRIPIPPVRKNGSR